ncbi:MAG: tRNA 2-thiouridine(34) synthase MnmA [Salinivirgaceae bacterium]|jgi:tRNA-specific 2-thiouridylase|nr:tRNA 2-thiouridine(34) synthase MnmA [Salinivirgaceae bacterium]
MAEKTKVVVGISGGVDSLATALLLQKQGAEVVGVTFIFTETQNNPEFKQHVKSVVDKLGINHAFVDKRRHFQETVAAYFVRGYMKGQTPNPCAFCNIYVKWPELFAYAKEVGAQRVAMGHYAQISLLNGLPAVQKGTDTEKDQSFFLWGLSPKQLSQIDFPMGQMDKTDVKKLVARLGFNRVASQKESTGPCFTGKNYRTRLLQIVGEEHMPGFGNFISPDKEVLGRHKGFPFYTVGQRHGLGLNLTQKMFVKTIMPATNQIVLAEPGALWSTGFTLVDFHVHFPEIVFHEIVEAKLRYRCQQAFARVSVQGDQLRVNLIEPEWAVAPGQTAVLYFNNAVVGGGFIERVDGC